MVEQIALQKNIKTQLTFACNLTILSTGKIGVSFAYFTLNCKREVVPNILHNRYNKYFYELLADLPSTLRLDLPLPLQNDR
ncbi:uncharacterized protein METZ01_LOCUS225100 [marine metagenome]|uniref:Uncharacterized protein n=1 Tax=marine metagenome TaxID=408172 RepID=A0A382GAG7_9ZZZZ